MLAGSFDGSGDSCLATLKSLGVKRHSYLFVVVLSYREEKIRSSIWSCCLVS
jgi:hypothetical protein